MESFLWPAMSGHFLICRTCYKYERREGNQVCPQYKTRFKCLKRCVRMCESPWDKKEYDINDLENEFNFDEKNMNIPSKEIPTHLMPGILCLFILSFIGIYLIST